jgi:hypothetical protein
MFFLMLALFDLAGDEFRKAPLAICFRCQMHVDCWIGWYMLVFDFHEEDNNGECYGG